MISSHENLTTYCVSFKKQTNFLRFEKMGSASSIVKEERGKRQDIRRRKSSQILPVIRCVHCTCLLQNVNFLDFFLFIHLSFPTTLLPLLAGSQPLLLLRPVLLHLQDVDVGLQHHLQHRRTINTEENAKVVAAVWGTPCCC